MCVKRGNAVRGKHFGNECIDCGRLRRGGSNRSGKKAPRPQKTDLARPVLARLPSAASRSDARMDNAAGRQSPARISKTEGEVFVPRIGTNARTGGGSNASTSAPFRLRCSNYLQ